MKKSNTILVLAISIFTSILLIFLLIFFFSIIKNKNKHTYATLVAIENKIKEEKKAELLKDKILEVETTKEKLKSYYLDPKEIDIFVNYLENLGTKLGSEVTVKNVEVSKTIKNLITIKLLIDGSFVKVMQTIILLENSPYQINVIQTFLNKSIESGVAEVGEIKSKTQWQADVTFNILSL